MPIYEYRCTSCHQTFEVIQKLSDAPLRNCSHCSGPLQKLISRTAFHLKGGGWFINDYGESRSRGADEKGTKEPKSSEGGEADSKSSSGGCGSGSCGCSG